MGTQIFRVTVRGRFDGLDDATRARLLADADEHDNLKARFTESGTLTYDKALDFFSFRIQLRQQSDDGVDVTEEAFAEGRRRAAEHLAAQGLGYRSLKPEGTNMAAMWQ